MKTEIKFSVVEFKYDIVYRPVRDNAEADTLSRIQYCSIATQAPDLAEPHRNLSSSRDPECHTL